MIKYHLDVIGLVQKNNEIKIIKKYNLSFKSHFIELLIFLAMPTIKINQSDYSMDIIYKYQEQIYQDYHEEKKNDEEEEKI